MEDTRDTKGRFKPGTSGNPAGRPRGCASHLSRELQEAAMAILPQWIEDARNGDEIKQQFLLERGLPRFKAQLPNVEVEIRGENGSTIIHELITLIASGEISASVASEIAALLTAAAKSEEFEEFKAEVAALKTILKQERA